MEPLCQLLCGLVIEHEGKEPLPVPLTGVTVNVKLVDLVAEVNIEQRYVNKESNPIEAVYKFPLDEGAALCKFVAEVDGRTIEGIVKETEVAKTEYQEAIESGHTAFLVEEKLPDVFKAKVGNLLPGSGAKIRLTYISELKTEGDEIRFYLPTTIAPRYVPARDNSSAAADLASIHYITDSKYNVEITASVKMASEIETIRCPSHKIVTNTHEQKKSATVSLECDSVAMDRDWVLYIKTKEAHKPRYIAEKSEDGTWALMLSLVPSFQLAEQKTELIFVVDRSGSMQGAGIEQARQAMTLFLHSLPADCFVNIVGFGFSFQPLFPESRKYGDEVLATSKKHVQEVQADLGGTEILQPLEWIFQQPTIPGYLRQVFLLTDGEVSNVDEVVSLTSQNQQKARVFALGLGSSASHHLIEGIARAGNGSALFASLEERLEKKVLQQLQDALQPAMTDVTVSWEGLQPQPVEKQVAVETEKTLLGFGKPVQSAASNVEKASLLRQAPNKCPPVFDGRHLVVYALLDKSVTAPPQAVLLSANAPVGPLTARVTLCESVDGQTVHRLAARKLIQELQDREVLVYSDEEKDPLKKEIINLGCKYGLASRFTAFVAVDPKQQETLKESLMLMKTRDVPNALAYGWGGRGMMQPCSMPMMGRSAPCVAFGAAPVAVFGSATPVPMACKSFQPAPPTLANARPSMNHRMQFRGGFTADICESQSLQCDSVPDILPPAPEPAKKMETDDDKLINLVALQRFDGSFNLDPLLATLLNVTEEQLVEDGQQLGFQDSVWATLVALAYMAVALEKLQSTWHLISTKAVKWLSSQQVDVKGAREKVEAYTKAKLGKL